MKMTDVQEKSTILREPTNDNTFRLNFRVLYFLGLWPLADSSWLYKVYSAASLASAAVTIAMCAFRAFYNLRIEEMTSALNLMFELVSSFFNALLLLKRQPEIDEMARLFEEVVSDQRKYFTRDVKLASAFRNATRWAALIIMVFLVHVSLVTAYWVGVALLQPAESRTLPFIDIPFVQPSRPLLFWFTFVLHCYSTYFCDYVTLTIEFLFLTVMMHISVQFKILRARFASLGKGKVVGGSSISESGVVPQKEKSVYEELCLCVRTHQKLLRFVRRLERLVSFFAMTQFVNGTLTVSMVLFQSTENQNPSTYLKWAAWLPGPISWLFIYCWGGHEVQLEGEAVALAAYGDTPYHMTRRISQALLLVMTRSQKPLVMTAGRLFPINRATFVSLVNAAYSYYALLSQINSR